MKEKCCGNLVCEPGKENCSDCGPFELNSGGIVYTCGHSPCYAIRNFMFDMQAINDVEISGLLFDVYTGVTGENV
jgi:hypothetical protein